MRALTRFGLVLGILGFAAAPSLAQELSWAAKMFDKDKVDFGVVARGADTRYRLKIKNVYKEEVHISNVRTTCGCSAATPSTNTLASLEEAYVEIKMDTERFTRRKDSNVIVTFDAPYYAEVRIPITAYIRTDVVMTPGAANYGAVPQGEAAEKVIEINYAGREDWKIKEVKSPQEFISTQLEEVTRVGGKVDYRLRVTIADNAPVGVLREQLTLVTDDANSPTVPLLLEARVESDITVTPETIALGRVAAGETKRFNLVIRGRKPFQIDKIECESKHEGIEVNVPASAKAIHVLPVTLTAPSTLGNYEDHFVVNIAGRDEPVKIRLYGEITE